MVHSEMLEEGRKIGRDEYQITATEAWNRTQNEQNHIKDVYLS